jgi:hypothetical protein
MIEENSQIYFEKKQYIKVSNLVNQEVCKLLYEHIKDAATRLCILENENIVYDTNESSFYGTFKDHQSMGDYSRYGDPIFDTLLKLVLPTVENIINKKLIPTYSYHRLYTNGSELKKHIDRKECDISMTLCLGYDIENLKNNIEFSNYNWPMYVMDLEDNVPVGINLEPGECIIYRGCNLTHWREPYLGNNHAQVFLHFNEKTENNTNLYDGRYYLGLPKSFNNKK